jgi:hypothetical protein
MMKWILRQLLPSCIWLLSLATPALSQTVTLADQTGEAVSITGGEVNVPVLSLNLTRSSAADLTGVAVTFSSAISGVFTNLRLYESSDAIFSAGGDTNVGSLSLVAGNEYSVTFTARAIGGGAGTNYFIVVDVEPNILSSVTINASTSATQITSTGTEAGGPATGPTYNNSNINELTVDFTQNADDATAVVDENGVTLLAFSANSNGTQSLVSPLVLTFNTDVNGILENFDLRVGGVNIAGSEVYTLNVAGTQLTISSFSSVDVTNATDFELLADIKSTATASSDFTIGLTPSGISTDLGYKEAFGTFSNSIDVTALEVDLTQNADDGSALADENGVTLLAFSANSNGVQSITTPLVFTFNTDVTNILENFNLLVGGLNVSGSEIYTLNGAGTQLTISAFTNVDVTNSTDFELQADIRNTATSANDFTISLVPGGVTVSPGTVEAFGTFSNAVNVTGLEADFTQNADDAIALADQNGVELLDFTVNSNGTQTITPNLIFTFNTNVSTILENWDLQVGGVDIAGTEIYTLNGGGTQLTISGFTGVDVTNATNFQLFADIQAGATTANDFTITLTPGNVTISPGTVEAFGSFTNSIDIVSSQNSDIILTGGTTPLINYRSYQGSSIGPGQPLPPDPAASQTLADYQIRDGGASSDADNQATIVTSIELQFTNAENLRQVALFDDFLNTEIAGTEQTVPAGPGTVTMIFTPSTPITVADDGTFDLNVRATFESAVTDNHAIRVSIISITSSALGSGFSSVGSWASTQTAINTNVINVVASKFIVAFSPSTQTINAPFTITVQAVDQTGFQNRDLDYSGKVDLARSPGGSTFTATQGFIGQTLSTGQFIWTNAQFSASNSYTIEISDDEYTDPPESQSNLGDAAAIITITSSSSTITTATDPVLCYGSVASGEILSNIVITETDAAGISGANGTYTFSLALPTGFVFDQAITTGLGVSGGSDLSTPSNYSYPAANVVQFSFSLNGTANINTITIGGLRVQYPHPGTNSPPPTGVLNITRLGGTAAISGVIPGTVLGQVSASQLNPAVTFTVEKALVTDPPVDPNTTTFNINGAAVKLVSSVPAGSVFSGSGVTFTNPDYRFNPSSLSAGIYPVTLLQTNGANGCQSAFTKNFEVIASGIIGLNPSYCTNAPPATGLSVSQAYIDQIMGGAPGTWNLDNFVYFDWSVGNWVKITIPSNDSFDPSIAAYQLSYQTFRSYGYPGLAVGFAVCNNGTTPCNGSSTYIATYQWVDLKNAPDVSFSLPSDIYVFCEDNTPVTLVGNPPNSTDILDDNFTATAGQGASISHNLVAGEEVWTFSPALVAGVTSSTSQTFDIIYQYTDPQSGCVNTSTRQIAVHDRPTIVPVGDVTKSPPGLPASTTTIQLCQGTASPYSFSATDNTYTYRWYSDPPNPGNLKSVGPSFNPSVNTLVAGSTPFHVTRDRNGCESINTPLGLTVTVVASPAAPSPNFPNSTRQYCVGSAINDNHLTIPTGGNTIKWYNSVGVNVYTGGAPTSGDLGLSTASANLYTFRVTATEPVNNCEGPATTVTVTIIPLPVVTISAVGFDPSKICTTGGEVRFAAFDITNPIDPIAPNGNWSGSGPSSLGSALNEFPTLGEVELDPSNLLPGNYMLTYDYTNNTGCSNTGSLNFTILPTVTPNIVVGNVCDDSPAIILNTSSINNGVGQSSTISTAEWVFGDGQNLPPGPYLTPIDPAIHAGNTTGTYASPQHTYPNVGTFQITGSFITSDGCKYPFPVPPATITVNVSPLPKANFNWRFPCLDTLTNQSSTVFQGLEQSTPTIPVTYAWNFALNNQLSFAGAGTGANPTVNYSLEGTDSVRLVITTAQNCKDSIQKPVNILRTYRAIENLNAYTQDFETGPDGWTDGGKNSRWTLGGIPILPAGRTIQSVPATGAQTWFIDQFGQPSTSIANQQSWVISGCFDFTSAVKPVIALDIWSDTPEGLDGTVLQYNTSGNIETDDQWQVVGDLVSGINWYDDDGIANSPGNQPSQDVGWTGSYTGWQRAVYPLDAYVIGQYPIVFRMAFASAQGRKDGFAFDNIFIGERSRVVLFENFTNASVLDNNHNEFYNTYGNTAEVVKVQYHTPFPGEDEVNTLNTQMHNARSAFYGITSSVTFRVDGTTANSNPEAVAIYNNRALTPATLTVTTNVTKVGSHVEIQNEVKNIGSTTARTNGTHLFTVLVERTINSPEYLGASGNDKFKFVAKDIFPSPSGLRIDQDILPGESIVFPPLIWEDRKLINPDSGAIISFVQSVGTNNKAVLQANILNLTSGQIPDVITQIEDPTYANKIQLFPNPANHEINIRLPEPAQTEVPVTLVDAHGRVLYTHRFAVGEQQKTVLTTDWAGGVYILQLRSPAGEQVRKKVMVVHQR